MKKLLSILTISLLFACNNGEQTGHETVYSENGKDSVVKVQYVQADGSSSNFFMNYLLFRSLMGGGGYSNVYHYYQSHPAEFTTSSHSTYSRYTPPQPKVDHSSSSSSYTPSNAKPSSGIYSGSSSSSKSWSSPSRSSSSTPKSYSSPSRSSSTPARSYSSPSRSYSSPSRSFSSPSRGH